MFLQGREADPWEESCDLVGLAGVDAEKDIFTRWISNKCVPWFHKRFGYRMKVPQTIE